MGVGVRYGAPKVSAMWTFGALEKLNKEGLMLKMAISSWDIRAYCARLPIDT